MMRDAGCLVISVPKTCKFSPVKNIALASDFSAIKENKRSMERFLDLLRFFEAHVYVVRIGDAQDIPDGIEAANGLKLEAMLQDVPHTFHQYTHSDVAHGLNEFAGMYHAEMVAMIPHKHGFFDELIHGSATRKMAFHGNVPLLVLPLG
jgi:nucleotide-binding universal stress UspA family protein